MAEGTGKLEFPFHSPEHRTDWPGRGTEFSLGLAGSKRFVRAPCGGSEEVCLYEARC